MSEAPAPLDRVDIMGAVMAALIADGARPDAGADPDSVGTGALICTGPGIVAGLAVAREAFGRMGVRLRTLVDDGDHVEAGRQVAELGGPLAAMSAAAPTALRFLTRLSAIASGHAPAAADAAPDPAAPDPADPLDGWAARLSPEEPFGQDGPSFELEVHG